MFGQKHRLSLKALGLSAFVGVAAFGSVSASAQVAPIAFPGTQVSLSDLLPGGRYAGGVIIGDKVFTDFNYVGSPDTTSGSTNPAPTAANISVAPTSGLAPNVEGLTFSAPWNSSSGRNQDSVISYAVHTLSGLPLISAIGLDMNGATFTFPPGSLGAVTTVTESAYQATYNPSTGHYQQGTELTGTVEHLTPRNSPITVYNDGTGASYDTNQNLLTLTTPQSAVYVRKDIQDTTSPTGAVATISWVDNTFQQAVPEPATAGLFGLAVLGLTLRRRNG